MNATATATIDQEETEFWKTIRIQCDVIDAARNADYQICIEQRLSWSPWRAMVPYENWGAMYCGMCQVRPERRLRKRYEPARMVSYCIGIKGRVVACDKCAAEWPREGKTINV